MTIDEKIRESLQSFINSMVPLLIQPAKVTAVDMTKQTCDVSFLDPDLAPHNAVHLTAGISSDFGFVPEPELNSVVYVAFVNNDEQWAFVALFTKLASLKLRGDQHGGLVKVADNVDRLNKIEQDLNNLKTAFKSWVTSPNDGGAALKAITATWFGSSLELTKQSHIENKEVQHG
ncbi:MAG: hypothetical protein Q8O72_10665 [Bacteroidales bacterium]|nr:hypothetical protein [Bacteroidales bacterium]